MANSLPRTRSVTHPDAHAHEPHIPAVPFEIGREMREKLHVMWVGHRLVSNARLNVAQLHAVVPGAAVSDTRNTCLTP